MKITFVLVSPSRAENVGAAARAMKTMGFDQLRIVQSDAHSQPAARWVAHGSGDILDNIEVYDTLSDALADVSLSIAATARSRTHFHYTLSPQQLLAQLKEKQAWVEHAALVFGREDSGLTNEELAQVDLLTTVPMAADYPSLNLGQSVMVYCYQLSELCLVPQAAEKEAEEHQLSALRARINKLLTQDLALDRDEKLFEWTQQRLGFISQRDTAMLHMLLHDLEKILHK